MRAVLHGTWVTDRDGQTDGLFFVWTERARRELPAQHNKTPRILRHPYGATTIEIADLLSHYVPSIAWQGAQRLTRVALLPSREQSPIVPGWLAADNASPDPDTEPILAPWRVEGIGVSVLDMLRVLTVLPAMQNGSQNDHKLGEDLRYWGLVAKFGLELLARERFLPGMQKNGDAYGAIWLPYINDENDRERFTLLMKAMPPVCRAVVRETANDAREVVPRPYTVLSSFIENLVDSAVRDWAYASPNAAEFGLAQRTRRVRTSRVDSAWWQALYADDNTMAVPEAKRGELDRFQQSWRSWTYPSQQVEHFDFKLCFRLEAPDYDLESSEAHWRLEYLFQSVKDPSLLVPVHDVWQGQIAPGGFLDHSFENAQERLLAGLGIAAQYSTAIQRSLRKEKPESATLSAQEAFRFLRETAQLLQEKGFAVMVPPWWNRSDARLSVRAKLKGNMIEPQQKGMLSMDSLVEYDWELALGDEVLTKEEFERLAQLKTPLVQVRGRWVLLQPDQVEAAIAFWEKQQQRSSIELHEALGLALGVEDELDGLTVSAIEVDGWLASLLSQLDSGQELPELNTPEDFVGELRPYQKRGLSWLAFLRHWHLGACLADDMGLGKTIQAIALVLHERKNGGGENPTLLVCPTSLVGNWKREIQRFAPDLNVMVHHGTGRAEGENFIQQSLSNDIVVSTYGLVRRDLEDLRQVRWANVILDEAQNIKNPYTKQARAVRLLDSDYRIALTGTPIENRLSELWSIISFLLPGYLGSLESFRREFAVPIERFQDEAASEKLRILVRPFVLRRVKTDPQVIQDLPEKFEYKVYCNLTREQASLYQAVVQNGLSQLNQDSKDMSGIRRRGMVLTMLTRLKQICDHPALYLADGSASASRSGKLNRLTEMLEEVLAVGDRALVFTQFAQMGFVLQRHLQEHFGQEVLFLHGGTPQRQRDHMLERFQEDERAPSIFVLSLKAGGLGLNLMRANHVFHYDRWWNPAVENQATDRAYRIGQTQNVQVHKFICPGTLEERIDTLIESKRELAENVVGSGEGWLTELSTDELKDVILLRSESIDDELGDD